MITVTFINAEGDSQEVHGVDGQSLLDLAQAAGQPLEGTCEGQMACSTCHVIIDKDWFDKLPPAVEDEEDMLDLATGARRTSRLSCQITLTPALDGLVVHVPAESRNMQGL
jgi:ferredoxin